MEKMSRKYVFKKVLGKIFELNKIGDKIVRINKREERTIIFEKILGKVINLKKDRLEKPSE